jgi:hypothetical protein
MSTETEDDRLKARLQEAHEHIAKLEAERDAWRAIAHDAMRSMGGWHALYARLKADVARAENGSSSADRVWLFRLVLVGVLISAATIVALILWGVR